MFTGKDVSQTGEMIQTDGGTGLTVKWMESIMRTGMIESSSNTTNSEIGKGALLVTHLTSRTWEVSHSGSNSREGEPNNSGCPQFHKELALSLESLNYSPKAVWTSKWFRETSTAYFCALKVWKNTSKRKLTSMMWSRTRNVKINEPNSLLKRSLKLWWNLKTYSLPTW